MTALLLAARVLLGGWIKSAVSFAQAIPPKVWYALAIIAAVLLLWHIHSVKERAAYNAAFNAGFAAEKVNTDLARADNAIQRASIAQLEGIVRDKNAESDARALALSGSRVQDATDVSKADAAQKADASRKGTLEGIRDGAALKPTCKVPDALTASLGGL